MAASFDLCQTEPSMHIGELTHTQPIPSPFAATNTMGTFTRRAFRVFLVVVALVAAADAGPLLAAACPVACPLILNGGCVAFSIIVSPFVSPAAAAIIGSSCMTLQNSGGIPACIATCLALPTP